MTLRSSLATLLDDATAAVAVTGLQECNEWDHVAIKRSAIGETALLLQLMLETSRHRIMHRVI